MIKIKSCLKALTPSVRKPAVIYRHEFNFCSFEKDSCIIEKLCSDFDNECSFMVRLGLRTQEEYNEFKVRHIFLQLKSHLLL